MDVENMCINLEDRVSETIIESYKILNVAKDTE